MASHAEGRQKAFASRAGAKLAAALDAFEVDVRDRTCADLGCNVGGFTDCLLRRGAAKVYAVDTGYGALDWRLRNDKRVVVMERTNALHCPAPHRVDVVVIDVGWTPQGRIVPAGRAWLRRGGLIVSLLKPHYELAKLHRHRPPRPLDPGQVEDTCLAVCRDLAGLGLPPLAMMRSPLVGKGGNPEFFLLLAPVVENP